MIAASTGGRAFINSNDIEGAINRAITDADVTYTLGFYPAEPAPGDRPFHQLKLEVARSGVELLYRQRYATVAYQPPPDRLVADAVQSAVDSTQVGLTARVENSGSSWRITLSIDAADLSVEGGDRRTGSAQMLFVQRSADGKELDRTSRDLALNFDEARYQAVLKQGLETAVALEPKPGAADVKVVVLDRVSNALGSLTIPAPR
jgi:hypothetical protein